ncbi:MAG: LLM class flavin-dependent oxidoreductase [Porticoccaceae bacterium]|nr:LLM class flavin-dependent oxidoreductase [Porticoccaceae bacterium]
MKLGYFTERPYRHLDEDVVLKNKAFFGVPNSHYDEKKGAHDYNQFIDEYCLAEDVGFDGLALNEHHGNPYCMGAVINIEAAVLARVTSKAKIILIGNPLPVVKHPLRVAEELATIDSISEGRLISGWVRGAGSEQFFNNANPAYNREMFNEAHDFILQAWTKEGPWRYEGKHFHYRHVNPWVLPYQKPYPQQWIPGVLSPETVLWCAEKRYPYLGLGSALGATCDLWDMYADKAAELGYQAGPENFGYLLPVHVSDNAAEAQEIGRGYTFGGGQNGFSRPEHTLPPGYNSKGAIRMMAKAAPGSSWLGIGKEKLEAARSGKWQEEQDFEVVKEKLRSSYERAQENLQIVAGTPEQVIPKIKAILRVIRPGSFTMFGVQGVASDEQRNRSIELLGKEVLPVIREYAREIGLVDSFEREPGSVKLAPGTKREPVCDRGAMKELGMKVA